MDDPAEILAELTAENSGDWQFVGNAMRRLNQISEVSSKGRPWHDVMLDALAAKGHSMSSGHLHRIRRAFDFLEEGMRERSIPIERTNLAKISSLDQAERLFQLNREAGLDALEACLDIKNPATKADIQKRYEDYLALHPEKKTPMQAAWDRRRAERGKPIHEMDTDPSFDANTTDIATILHRISGYVTDLETTVQKNAATIAALEQEVADVSAELKQTKQDLQIASEELTNLQSRRKARSC